MKVFSDYHTHSIFSSDGNNSMVEMCEQAIELGLTEIAFTEHVEWVDGWYGFLNVAEYWQEVQRIKPIYQEQGLKVLSGAEIGNPHQYQAEVGELVNTYSFDVVIGSIHWIRGQNIHSPKCFAGNDIYEVYAEYFVEMSIMAEQAPINFVAHFDRIFREGIPAGGEFDGNRLRDIVQPAFARIVEANVGLELNLRYLVDIPDWLVRIETMLGWFVEVGGNGVYLNSDAHNPSQILMNVDMGELIANRLKLEILHI